MEARPKVFIVSAHAAAKQHLISTARRIKSFYFKILVALALLLGVGGALSYQRFDSKTAIRAAVKVNAVVYENGRGTLVKTTGALLSADGIIVTNFRNVDNARYVWVQNSVGQTADATVVTADSSAGIALLKIEGHDLPFVRLGNSGSLGIGDIVHAVGSNGGLDFLCQSGNVAGLNPQVDEHLFQTDIPFSPGCGGGPLFDGRGKLVGIAAAESAVSGGQISAVPVSLVRQLLEKYFSAEKSGDEVTNKSEAVLNNKWQ